MRRHHQIVMLVGMGLYILSLALPAFVARGTDLFGHTKEPEVIYGFQCLVTGFIVLPGWLANPLLLVGAPLLAAGVRRPAIVLLSLALMSALIAPFLLMEVDLTRLDHLHVGYYAWLGSIVTLLVAALLAPVRIPIRTVRPWSARGGHPQ